MHMCVCVTRERVYRYVTDFLCVCMCVCAHMRVCVTQRERVFVCTGMSLTVCVCLWREGGWPWLVCTFCKYLLPAPCNHRMTIAPVWVPVMCRLCSVLLIFFYSHHYDNDNCCYYFFSCHDYCFFIVIIIIFINIILCMFGSGSDLVAS